MTDIDRYRDGADHCAKMAGQAMTNEFRDVWATIERAYRFLLDREERIDRAHSRLEGN
jgi:hypothetical protein